MLAGFLVPWDKPHTAFLWFAFLLCPSACQFLLCSRWKEEYGREESVKKLRISYNVFRQRRWQTGSLILENNLVCQGLVLKGETLIFHPQHVRTEGVLGANPKLSLQQE